MRLVIFPCLLIAMAAGSGAEDQTAALLLRVVDENGRPATARVRLRDAEGRWQPVRAAQPQVAIHPRFPELGVVVEREARITLPAGRTTLVVERGAEYRAVTLELDPAPGQTLERQARLARWIDMAGRGWWSGDLHVHRLPAEMPALLESADLHFAPTITRWNENTNMAEWPAQTTWRAAADRYYSVDNAEDEREWGAALFFGLKTPMPLYARRSEYPPPTATWSVARGRGAMIDQEKVIWWAAPVIAALVRPDTMGLAINHFLEEGMLDSEAWGRPRDRERYPGQAGFARYVFDLYYRYLNSGFRVPASAGSANGVLKNPLGYSRSYAYLGKDFTPARWLDAQKAGNNFVTNGPMLFLRVRGGGPGTVLPGKTAAIRVELEALSAGELEKAEVVVDGVVAQTFAAGGADRGRIRASARIAVQEGGWLAARCFEKNAQTVRFAHTSPVYVGDVARRSAEALAAMREWIDTYMERVGGLPPAALSAKQKDEWLALCRQAREFYATR